jgi:hypothetical protein
MPSTANLGMTLLSLGQSQKEVTVNAALRLIDAVSNIGVKDKDLNTPPASPAESDLYIIGPSPTGVWAGKSKQLAVYTGGTWVYIPPKEGVCFWVMDEDVVYVYNGTAWVTLSAGQSLVFPPGSASSPSVFPSGDTDTGMYQVAANVLGFSVGGSEVVRIGSGGLSFDEGTTYEKVEVGTWTPLLQGATTPGTPTYTYNAGSYRKVGTQVMCFLRMNISARGGLAGTVQLAGLPFASSSATNHVGGAILGIVNGVSMTAGIAPSWRSVLGTSTMELYGSGSTTGTAVLTETSITDSFNFRGLLIYRT